jgi:hypothetical protein
MRPGLSHRDNGLRIVAEGQVFAPLRLGFVPRWADFCLGRLRLGSLRIRDIQARVRLALVRSRWAQVQAKSRFGRSRLWLAMAETSSGCEVPPYLPSFYQSLPCAQSCLAPHSTPRHATPLTRANRKASAPEGGWGGEVVCDDGKEAVVIGHIDAVPPEEELDQGLELRLKLIRHDRRGGHSLREGEVK